MKTVVIVFTFFASIFTKSSFANNGADVAPEVLKAFQSTFASAKDANWSVTNEFYKVEFAMDGQYVTAFYKEDGTMSAITRNISSVQLPVNLQTALKKDYKGYWISELFELSNNEGVQYYVTLENADSKTILHSTTGTWSVFQKEKKD